jgi:cell shape-determining protein MreC
MVIGLNLGCTISNVANRKMVLEFVEATRENLKYYDKKFWETYKETERLNDENERLTSEIEKLRCDRNE